MSITEASESRLIAVSEALFTTTSSPPSSVAASATKASTALTSDTSTDRAKTRPPFLASSAATRSRAPHSRPQIATAAPSADSRRAAARPIPFPPPVTIATRPSNRRDSGISTPIVRTACAARDHDTATVNPPSTSISFPARATAPRGRYPSRSSSASSGTARPPRRTISSRPPFAA